MSVTVDKYGFVQNITWDDEESEEETEENK